MKTYKTDIELETVLQKNGFMEVTSAVDKQKGKKTFKLYKSVSKSISFDYANIRVNNGDYTNLGTTIKEDDLKITLLFFLLKGAEHKELFGNTSLKVEESKERLEKFREELKHTPNTKSNHLRQNKIRQILDLYENLNLQ